MLIDRLLATPQGARPPGAERVLPEEVAATVRHALVDVVQNGTARRPVWVRARPMGAGLMWAARPEPVITASRCTAPVIDWSASRIVGRPATFVFLIGDRYFETVMVYAHGPFARVSDA